MFGQKGLVNLVQLIAQCNIFEKSVLRIQVSLIIRGRYVLQILDRDLRNCE
jgi:hypothetical protein